MNMHFTTSGMKVTLYRSEVDIWCRFLEACKSIAESIRSNEKNIKRTTRNAVIQIAGCMEAEVEHNTPNYINSNNRSQTMVTAYIHVDGSAWLDRMRTIFGFFLQEEFHGLSVHIEADVGCYLNDPIMMKFIQDFDDRLAGFGDLYVGRSAYDHIVKSYNEEEVKN